MPSFKKSLIVEQFQGNYLKALTKFQVKKRFNSPSRLLPGLVGSFYSELHDEFHAPNVLIVLLYM